MRLLIRAQASAANGRFWPIAAVFKKQNRRFPATASERILLKNLASAGVKGLTQKSDR